MLIFDFEQVFNDCVNSQEKQIWIQNELIHAIAYTKMASKIHFSYKTYL